MGVCEVAEDFMIIPIIVISFFERSQRLVEDVSGDDVQCVNDGFLMGIELLIVLIDQIIQS